MLAGPFCTRLLADFGAEVIKVQCRKTATGAEDNLTPQFNAWNRNKRGVTLDLSFPEARELARRLVVISDVVVENFSPRVMENWGLAYPALRRIKPEIIMVSISAMGRTGPWRDYVAYAPTIHALAGLTHLTSFGPEEPLGPGFPLADVAGGLFAALGTLAALQQREADGKGRHLDLSVYESVCSLLGPSLLHAAADQAPLPPAGNRPTVAPAAPHGVYRCRERDRWCAIAVRTNEQWRAFCQTLGQPAWCGQRKFATLAARMKHSAELDGLVEKWTRRRSPQRVAALLQEAGIPAGVVQDAADLANDPQLKAHGFWDEVSHPALGKMVCDRQPMRFVGEAPGPLKAAPLLGEANEYVFKKLLGLSSSQYSRYRRMGVIA